MLTLKATINYINQQNTDCTYKKLFFFHNEYNLFDQLGDSR